MAVDFDAKLTGLAAGILRQAIAELGSDDIERWLSTANVGVLGGMDLTGSFTAITSSFPALTASLPALTGALPALGPDEGAAGAGLKKVFQLPGKLAPLRLPSRERLGQLARSAPLMTELEALARWLGGSGRPADAEGDLSAADSAAAARSIGVQPEYLPYLWDYALASGWLELTEEPGGSAGRVAIGATAWRWAEGDDTGALHVWAVVFAAVLASALDVAVALDPDAARKLNFEGQGVVAAVTLFVTGRSGLSDAEIGKLIMGGSIGSRPSGRSRRAWDGWVRGHGDPARWLLRELGSLHAVHRPRGDEMVELTPLALWSLRTQLRLDGVEVPVITTTAAKLTAAALVSVVDGMGPAEVDAESAPWIGTRGPDRAARELLAFAAFSGPRPRLVAVSLVRRIGPAAYRAWRDAIQRPELRGYARVALAMMSAELPESTLPLVLDVAPEDLNWMAADLIALACGDVSPDPERIAEQFRAAVEEGEEPWVLGLLARCPSPDAAKVLAALARYHPDRQVAKLARRAARGRTPARAARVPARAGAR